MLQSPSSTTFPMGRVVATFNAHSLLTEEEVTTALARHAQGDWGELPVEDIRTNDKALACGGRLFSAYRTGESRFWVITEADRSVTTVLLPQDY